MSSNAFDVQRPATEVEIAEALSEINKSIQVVFSETNKECRPYASDTIRRLAFERDRLLADAARWQYISQFIEPQTRYDGTAKYGIDGTNFGVGRSLEEVIDALIEKEKDNAKVD